jgi:hypothetical protein
MEWWSGVGAAIVAAVVSLATSIVFRWWESRRVVWVVTGEAYEEYSGGRATGKIRAELELHNAGDGDAFDVRLTRYNGGEYKTWDTFEGGRIAPGETVSIKFNLEHEIWKTAWFEVIARATPVHRSKTNRSPRYIVADVTGPARAMPPSPTERAWPGWGRRLRASDGE